MRFAAVGLGLLIEQKSNFCIFLPFLLDGCRWQKKKVLGGGRATGLRRLGPCVITWKKADHQPRTPRRIIDMGKKEPCAVFEVSNTFLDLFLTV